MKLIERLTLNLNSSSKKNLKNLWQTFQHKVEKELTRIERYIYMDLAGDNMDLKDLKYLVKCLNNSEPRLSKFCEFLK